MKKIFYLLLAILTLSLFTFSCKKEKLNQLYPVDKVSSTFTGTVQDSNALGPISGIPILVQVYRSYGTYDKFLDTTDDKGSFKLDISVQRKFDSVVYIINIAAIPGQTDYGVIFDSTKNAFKYGYKRFTSLSLDNLSIKSKLNPIGKIKIEVKNRVSQPYDSMFVSSDFKRDILKGVKDSSGIFYVSPSKIQTFSYGGYLNGKVAVTKIVNFYIPNGLGLKGYNSFVKKYLQL